MNIYDIVTAANVKGYYEESVNGQVPTIGERLFPARKQLGLKLSYIKGKGGVPVVLKPSAFDTRVTLRDRIGLESIEMDMPFFKEAYLIKERDRQELLTMLQTNNNAYVDGLVRNIFDDAKNLLVGARAQRERLRMQLLTTGKISVTANNVNLEYDYGLGEDNLIKTTKPWTDPTANIGEDLIKWLFNIRAKGNSVTTALTNSTTLFSIGGNKEISKAILAAGNGAGIVTPQMVAQYVQSKFGFTFIINDDVFVDEEEVTQKYIPDGLITFLPSGPLGETVFGTTPEEADLNSGTNALVSLVDTGVAITTVKKTDPVTVETKVSMVTIPSFGQADKVYIADITQGV